MENRIQSGQHAGQIYRELPDERSRPTEKSLCHATTKQNAEQDTGKDRSTLNRWAKEAGKMLLDTSQRAMLATEMLPEFEAEVKKRQGRKLEPNGTEEPNENEDIRVPVLPFGESRSLPLGNSIGITLWVTPIT